MKAKEYFEKYDTLVQNDSPDGANTMKLILELSEEVKTITKSRNVRKNSSFVSVIKEINQKWNAICNLFAKKYGHSVLKENGFKNFWIASVPELKNQF